MTAQVEEFGNSRFAQILGAERAGQFLANSQEFLGVEREPEDLAKLFATFRVGEHHAVITIGGWLADTPELDVKSGYARLIWDEARHTTIWTRRMQELIGKDRVQKLYPDPRSVDAANAEYFHLWDEYARADCLAKRLAYIYVVDAWAGFAYTTYLNHVDPVTRFHLQTILSDERFHVSFGEEMAGTHIESGWDRDILAREEEKIVGILQNVTDGFLSSVQ